MWKRHIQPHNNSDAAELLDDVVVRNVLADHWAEMLGVGVQQVNGRGVGEHLGGSQRATI
jgi:hypothetical protein